MRRVRCGQFVRQYGPNIHMHKQGTPTMGGVVFLLVLCASFFLYGLSSAHAKFALLGTLLLGGVGLVDDVLKVLHRDSLGLKARYKFALQALASVFLLALLPERSVHVLQLPGTLATVELHGVGSWLWLFFVFSGSTHAFNLTDGLDGLAAGVGLIALLALGAIAAWQGQHDVLLLVVTLAAVLLAFLWFNRHPAQLFMGDTGSFALGGFVAAVTFFTGLELYLLLFALVPVVETLSVALQLGYYRLTQRRIFKIAPLHHHFEAAKGVDYRYLLPTVEWPETKITWMLWGVSSLGVVVGLLLYAW